MSFLSNLITAGIVYLTGPAGWAGYLAGASFAAGTYADMDARRRARNARADYNRGLNDRYQMLKTATAARAVVYGRTRASGPLLFAHSTGDKQQYLHLVVALAGHEIDGIEGVYLNDTLLAAPNATTGLIESGDFAATRTETRTVQTSATSYTATPPAGETFVRFVTVAERWANSSGSTTTYNAPATIVGNTATWSGTAGPGGSYVRQGYTVTYEVSLASPRVRVRYHLGGTTGGQPFPELVAESGGKWGSATHLCRGISAVYLRLEYDQDIWGQIGMPQVSAVVRGRKVLDPRENRLLRSQEFDNAVWTKSAVSVTANAATAPDGTVTADKIAESTTATGTFNAIQSAGAFTAGQTVTWSCYLKSAERSDVQFRVSAGGAMAAAAYAYINLSTGTVAAVTGALSASATSVGSGWWRCTLTFTTTGTGAVNAAVVVAV